MTHRFATWLIVALLIVFTDNVSAQWDTTLRRNLPPALSGTAMIGAGALLTFQPDANALQVSLRDKVVQHDWPHTSVDNTLQYLPAAAPLALSIVGLKGRHNTARMATIEGLGYLIGAGWLNTGKYTLGIMRPDGTSHNSFPSGHSFMAFAGAETLRREYGTDYPWVAVAGYAVAIAVGAMRIYNNRHWAGDVLAGAGLGIASITIAYWLLD